MVEQGLNFIDEQVLGNSYIYEEGTSTRSHTTESKTYPYVIKKNGEIVFYGNKFIKAGETKTKLNLTDFIRFNVYTPTYDKLEASVTNEYINNDIISTLNWSIYNDNINDAKIIAHNIATVAAIWRYPNRIQDLEFMVGDANITQEDHTVFSSLIQGCEMDNSVSGKIGDVTGYKLLPRFPKYKHEGETYPSAHCFFGIQTSNVAGDGINVYSMYDAASSAVNYGAIGNIPTGVSSGYVRVNDAYNADGIGLIRKSKLPASSGEAYTLCQRICNIDSTPCARYYLMWQDRFGGYQCQPFCKGNTYSETMDSGQIKIYNNARQIVQVNVQPRWEINTKWITADLYPIYESIFTSKILCLIDTETGIEHQVILKDQEYTEKTFKNQSRQLFNLKLTLEETAPQQITY